MLWIPRENTAEPDNVVLSLYRHKNEPGDYKDYTVYPWQSSPRNYIGTVYIYPCQSSRDIWHTLLMILARAGIRTQLCMYDLLYPREKP